MINGPRMARARYRNRINTNGSAQAQAQGGVWGRVALAPRAAPAGGTAWTAAAAAGLTADRNMDGSYPQRGADPKEETMPLAGVRRRRTGAARSGRRWGMRAAPGRFRPPQIVR